MVACPSLAVLSDVAYSSFLPLSLYVVVLTCFRHPRAYTSLLGLSFLVRYGFINNRSFEQGLDLSSKRSNNGVR